MKAAFHSPHTKILGAVETDSIRRRCRACRSQPSRSSPEFGTGPAMSRPTRIGHLKRSRRGSSLRLALHPASSPRHFLRFWRFFIARYGAGCRRGARRFAGEGDTNQVFFSRQANPGVWTYRTQLSEEACFGHRKPLHGSGLVRPTALSSRSKKVGYSRVTRFGVLSRGRRRSLRVGRV